MGIGDKLVCIKETVFKSYPDQTVKVGEIVYVEGYLMGNLVVRLGDNHKSGYAHLPYCAAMTTDENAKNFKPVEEREE